MRKIVILLVILAMYIPCLAQSGPPVDSLRRIARERTTEITGLWREKAYSQALDMLRELAAIPDMSTVDDEWSGILYNMACAHSLLGNSDSALVYLGKSVEAGYYDYQHMEKDPDLEPLHGNSAFQELVEHARRQSEFWNSSILDTPYRDTLSADERLIGLSRLWMEVKLNFAFFDLVPELNWDSLYLAYVPQVREMMSTLEYFRTLQRMCAALHDGHTGINPPRELSSVVWASPDVSTALIEDKVLITRVIDEGLDSLGVKTGMEIVAIDGIPVRAYADSLIVPYVSASTPQGRDIQVYTYKLLNGREGTSVALTLNDGTNHMASVELLRNTTYTRSDPIDIRLLDNGLAYVNITSFSSDFVVDYFDSLFSSIQQSNGLIIDLRENGGGNSSVGYRILGYLTDTTFTTMKSETRTYSSIRRLFNQKQRWETVIWTQPPNGEKLFTGPVVVLAGPSTGSAAEDFLMAFDYMKRGTIIGEPSSGTTGQPMSFSLPGGIRARVCIRKCLYPDGKKYVGVGVQPDIVVKRTIADIRNGRDSALDAAVKTIRGR
jgi:C-terminal processing protease CtpA/Prc